MWGGRFHSQLSDSQMSPLSMRRKIEGIHERRSSYAIKRVSGEGDSSSGSQVVPRFNGVMLVLLFDGTCVWKCGFFLTLVRAVNHPRDSLVKQLSVLDAAAVK